MAVNNEEVDSSEQEAGADNNRRPKETAPAPQTVPSSDNAPSSPSGGNRQVSDGQIRVIVLLLILLGLEVLRSPQVRNFFKLTFKIPFTQAVSQQSGSGTTLSALQKMTGRTTN